MFVDLINDGLGELLEYIDFKFDIFCVCYFDFIMMYIMDSLGFEFFVLDIVVCEGGINMMLVEISGGIGVFIYVWSNG